MHSRSHPRHHRRSLRPLPRSFRSHAPPRSHGPNGSRAMKRSKARQTKEALGGVFSSRKTDSSPVHTQTSVLRKRVRSDYAPPGEATRFGYFFSESTDSRTRVIQLSAPRVLASASSLAASSLLP